MRDIIDIEMAIIGINYLGRAPRRLNMRRVNAQMIAAMALEGIAHG